MVIAAMQPAVGDELVGVRLGHDAVRDEALEHLGEREPVVLQRFCGGLHGREYSQPLRNRQAF